MSAKIEHIAYLFESYYSFSLKGETEADIWAKFAEMETNSTLISTIQEIDAVFLFAENSDNKGDITAIFRKKSKFRLRKFADILDFLARLRLYLLAQI